MAVRKTKKGLALKRWFKEDWKDVRSGKKCGRQKGEKPNEPTTKENGDEEEWR